MGQEFRGNSRLFARFLSYHAARPIVNAGERGFYSFFMLF